MQALFDKVFKQDAKGHVVQAYGDLDQVANDQKESIEAAQFLGIRDFGKDDEYILNKDFKDTNKSITSQHTKNLQKSLLMRLRKDPKKVHLGIFFLAGHGMICDGTQQFLLNEYCKTREFYKLYPIEKIARTLTETMKQSYLIVIVACCRENFNFKRHSNCVGADKKMQACMQFWLKNKA